MSIPMPIGMRTGWLVLSDRILVGGMARSGLLVKQRSVETCRSRTLEAGRSQAIWSRLGFPVAVKSVKRARVMWRGGSSSILGLLQKMGRGDMPVSSAVGESGSVSFWMTRVPRD